MSMAVDGNFYSQTHKSGQSSDMSQGFWFEIPAQESEIHTTAVGGDKTWLASSSFNAAVPP